MSDPENVGYEDLLKPLKDVLLKNWSMSLAHVLDKFLSQLQHDEITTNFSQAALLLQNSTIFYCKRVEVVFEIMAELTEGISHAYKVVVCQETEGNEPSPEDAGNQQGSSGRKKRLTTIRENDDLEVLDFVNSDHNIDLNVEKLPKRPSNQLTIPCKDVKVLMKPNTSIPLMQSSEVFIGYKSDFRLFSRIDAEGIVSQDFNYNLNQKISRSNSDEDLRNNNLFECVQNGIPSPSSHSFYGEASDSVSDRSTSPPPPQVFLKELSVRLIRLEDTEPITFDFVFPLKILKRRKDFELPKSFIKDVPAQKTEPITFDFVFPLKILKRRKAFELPKSFFKEVQAQKTSPVKPRKRKREDLPNKVEKVRESLQEDVGMELCRADPLAEDIIELPRIDFELPERNNESPKRVPESPDSPERIPESPERTSESPEGTSESPEGTSESPEGTSESLERTPESLENNQESSQINQFKRQRIESGLAASEVAKRVSDWHERVTPLIVEAQKRKAFNVHEYASNVLDHFDEEDTTFKPFGDVVVGQSKHEISRYFLSTLMLANTYNLEIRKTDPTPLATDCLELKLLNKVRHHEELAEQMRLMSAGADLS